jgi:hypothetical protein
MKLKMYTFLDSAAQAFTTPFFMHNDGLAIRAFQDNVNSSEENNMSLHPEQFTLFQVGEWDDKSASVETLEAPRKLALGVELINDETKQYSNIDLKGLQEQVQELVKYYKGKYELQMAKEAVK